jgi:hypothetical protein
LIEAGKSASKGDEVKLTTKRTAAALVAGGVLLAGSGAALAHGGPGGLLGFGPGGGNQTTLLNAVATNLKVSPASLRAAVKDALKAQVDQQVKDGRLTAAQAADVKERIANGSVHVGVGPAGADLDALDAAADYLGITPAALRTALGTGKSLADLAKDKGKTSEGLQAAIVAKATSNLAAAVAAGDLTDAQRDAILTRVKNTVDELVAQVRGPGLDGRGHGPGGAPGFRPAGHAFRR